MRARKFDYTDPTHQEKIMFGRTDLVIHLLDRNNISTEGIDEALTFSVHASTENIKSSTASSSSSSDLESSLQTLLASVRLVRQARVSCMPGAQFPRAFEPGNPLFEASFRQQSIKEGGTSSCP